MPLGSCDVVTCNCELAGFTVSVAGLLVTLPAGLLTTTANCAPLSEALVVESVKLEDAAPEIVAPFLCH